MPTLKQNCNGAMPNVYIHRATVEAFLPAEHNQEECYHMENSVFLKDYTETLTSPDMTSS